MKPNKGLIVEKCFFCKEDAIFMQSNILEGKYPNIKAIYELWVCKKCGKVSVYAGEE